MNMTFPGESSTWSAAAKAGVLLALVTVALTTVTTCFAENTLVNTAAWFVKLIGTICLLRFFMKKWGEAHEGESTFGFGFATSLCSAIIIAAYVFVLYKYLVPDQVAKVFEATESTLAGTPGISRDIIDKVLAMEDNYAQITSIGKFALCTLYGLIFSAILKGGTTRINDCND